MSLRACWNLARRSRWLASPTPSGARREVASYRNRLVLPFYPSAGFTPPPAVNRRCGIRLAPGGRRQAGAGLGLYVLARPLAAP
jgi:hypothetical protein